MKIGKCFLLVIFWCGFLSASMFAQSVRDVMLGNGAVYELVNEYVENSNLTENYASKVNVFKSLFATEQAELYMDHLLWQNDNEMLGSDKLPLSEYCRFYQGQQGSFSKNSYQVSDVSVQMASLSDNIVYYQVSLTKTYRLNIMNEKQTYKLLMDVQYSFASKNAKITAVKLAGKEKKEPFMMANYVKNERTFYVPATLKLERVDGSTINLGETVEQVKQSSYDNLKKKGSAVYLYEESKRNQYRELSVRTVKNALGIELGYGHPLMFSSTVTKLDMEGDFDGTTKITGHKFHVGIFYLRQLFALNRHRVSVEGGLQFAMYRQRFTADNYSEVIETNDEDGERYTRNTLVTNYNELSRAWCLAVPVKARYDYYVLNNMSVFAMLGVKCNILFWKPATAMFDALYSGQYGPELFNLYIDQLGYYDFGQFNGNKLTQEKSNAMGWNMESILALGLQYHFNESWSMEASASWQFKLVNASKQTGNPMRLTTDSEHFQSINDCLGDGKNTMEYQIRIKYNF